MGLITRKLVWINVIPEKELTEFLQIRNPYYLKNAFHELMIIQKDGQLYATKTKCPHQGKSLDGCWIEDERLVCPVHQYSFSLKNGRGHGLYLERYDTRVHEGWFQIRKEKWSVFGLLV